jgi:hypothetical protein
VGSPVLRKIDELSCKHVASTLDLPIEAVILRLMWGSPRLPQKVARGYDKMSHCFLLATKTGNDAEA